MADSTRSIELIFEATDKTAAAVQSALKNTQDFASSIQSATQPIADFTAAAVKLEAGLLASGAAVTAFAVAIAGDFDAAFREIATLIDQPLDALDGFRQSLLDYATSSTASLDEITQSVYSAISAGADYTDSLELVSKAEQLAVAGKADLNSTTVLLASTLNAYGAGMEQATRYSDALFTAVRLGQTTLPELSQSLSQVTGSAATLGIPFETLLAAFAALTATGAPTSEAMTRIGAVLDALIAPSEGAKNEAEALGIEFSAQAVKAKGLEVVLQEVLQATGGNEEQMQRLFGSSEALKAIFPLTGAAAGKFAENLLEMSKSAGATEAAFNKMADNISASMTTLQNSLKVLAISIGSPLLDEFGSIADAISGIFGAIAKSASTDGSGISELVSFVESQLRGLLSFVEDIAKNLPGALDRADFSGFESGLQTVIDAVKELFSGIDLTSEDGLVTAIELVGAGFDRLSSYVAGVIDSFKPLFNAITDVAGGLLSIDSGFFESAGKVGGFITQVNALAGALPDVLGPIKSIIDALTSPGGMIAALALIGGTTGIVGIGAATAALIAMKVAANDTSTSASRTALTMEEQLANAAIGSKTGLESLKNEAYDATQGLDSLSPAVSRAGAAADGIKAGADQAALAVDGFGGGAVKTGGYLDDFAASADDSVGELHDLSVSLDELKDSAAGTGSEVAQAGDAVDDSRRSWIEWADGTRTYIDAADGAADSSGNLAREAEGTAESVSKAGAEAAKTALEIRKLENDLAIANLEAVVTLEVAQLEADTKTAVAIIETLGDSITATADLLGSLYGELGEADNFRDRFLIEDQIKLENERREKDLKRLEKLTEAQIKLLKARADSLSRGDALITVSGDGLQPHLEAFMFAVLDAIQVKTNAEGLALLLGV